MKPIHIGEDFKPSPSFRPYTAIWVILIQAILWLCLLVPFWFSEEALLFQGSLIIFGLVLIFSLIWVPLYYRSVIYHLNTTEMTWRRGVWFRGTGIVPYNRITNVDIAQGPLMRLFKISSLKVQTAGYSGQKTAEIRLEGIEDPEPLRAMIMDFVRGTGPVAAVTGAEQTQVQRDGSTDKQEIIQELKTIRLVLEDIRDRPR
jgi:hypothetical protein